MPKVRVRFAPSPTGSLHVGGLRTALFNYLIAKSLKGKLILRIEDTDQKREVKGAVDGLIKILDWAGIKSDEGPNIGGDYGPYIQSERLEVYKKYIKELLDKDKVYYCFCSADRLKEMRENQQAKKQAPKYDRACRDLSKEEIKKKLDAGEPYVIRQKMPLDESLKVRDELRGEIEFKTKDLEDHVLIKSDGMPTYQFANVVDDYLMEISHVIRGEEWIPSLPKNILLYKDFGWETPKFIHLPLILNKDGGKLSKRQGDVAVEDFKDKGYLSESLINFCALLGWHLPNDNEEIFSLEKLVEIFKVEDLRTSGSVFDNEKLDYFNGYYIRQMNLDELVELCKPYLEKELKGKDEYYIKKAIALEQERLKKLSDIKEATEFFFTDELKYDSELLIWKKLSKNEVKKNLEEVLGRLEKIPEENWTDNSIEDAIVTYLKAKELKLGDYLWPMRVALTGRKASPGPFEVAEVLGKEKTLERINFAIKK